MEKRYQDALDLQQYNSAAYSADNKDPGILGGGGGGGGRDLKTCVSSI